MVCITDFGHPIRHFLINILNVLSDLDRSPMWGILVKGQIISKGLFDILEFFQKTNKQIPYGSKNEFVCSNLEELEDTKNSFSKLSDL